MGADRAGADPTAAPAPRWLAVLAVLVLVGIVAGCGPAASRTADGAAESTTTTAAANRAGGVVSGPADKAVVDGGLVRIGLEAEPEGLDPTRHAFTQAGHMIASAVFDPLATLDEQGRAVPYLATGFEHSDDYMTWTIGIPSGVSFHDGTPLTAEAVLQVLIAYRTSPIVGPALNAIVLSASAPDANHVVVKTGFPYRYVPEAFATQLGYIFAPSMFSDPKPERTPIGTGPFVFQSHDPGEPWLFKKNPAYRTKGLPHLDKLEFTAIPDDAERSQKLRAGDVDMLQTLGGPQIVELRESGHKLVENRNGDKAFMVLNTSKPPFDSVTARRAIAHATDSRSWRREVFADVATPANSPFGPGQPGYLADNGYPQFDLDAARRLVAQYQQESGRDLAFTFLTSDDIANAQFAQLFAPAYESVGMKVTVAQKPQNELVQLVSTGAYELSQFRLFANAQPMIDATFYRSTAIADVSLNFARFANPEIDRLTQDAAGASDPKQVDQDYQKVSRILAEQVPFVWLGQLTWAVAANAHVNGVGQAANGTVPGLTPRTWLATLSISR